VVFQMADSVEFMRREHSLVLAELHKEIERLQQKCNGESI